MFGSEVGVLSDSIFHLKRGNIYTINNKTFLTIGGATSTDKEHRLTNISWWKEEELSYNDIDNTLDSLKSVDYKVDYILSHTCPSTVGKCLYDRYYTPCSVQDFLNFIDSITYFKQWFFGHYHEDKKIGKYNCVYNIIKKL